MLIEHLATQVDADCGLLLSRLARERIANKVRVRKRRFEGRVQRGTQIGDYRVTRMIGEGGFGTVWHARRDEDGREAAIKVLRAEYVTRPQVLARFQREAEVVAMIEHDNIVRYHDFGTLPDGTPYMVMEYLVGTSLDKLLRRERSQSPAASLAIIVQLTCALEAAHAHGVIHRDIKTSNVMLCERADGSRRVVLLDFGIAKLLECHEPPITAPHTTVGSPFFMAPEQIRGDAVDVRTDVYGLGILVFELLAGALPFEGGRCEVLCAHMEPERPTLSSHDESLRAFDPFIRRTIALHPADRYPNMQELLAGFRAALDAHRGSSQAGDASARTTRAIGVYVQVDIDLDAAAGDIGARAVAAMDDVDAVLTQTARFLGSRGFVTAYEYSNLALFALPLPSGDPAEREQLERRALADARELRERFAQRTDPHDWVAIGIHVDVDEISLSGEGSREVCGGPLVDNAPPQILRDGAIGFTVSPSLETAAPGSNRR